MPTYKVTSVNLELSEEQRQAIAAAITDAHSRNTGAPSYYAQVIFAPVAAGDHFIGGRINSVPHIYVHGFIRAGRTVDQKRTLIEELSTRVCKTSNVGREDVWVYLQDIVPQQMVEFGRMLPEPGDEAQWQRGFSEAKILDFRRAGIAI